MQKVNLNNINKSLYIHIIYHAYIIVRTGADATVYVWLLFTYEYGRL